MTKINSWARYIHSLPRLLLSSTLSPNISVCHDFLASPVRRAHSCVFNYRGTFNFPPSILDVLDGRSEIIHPVGICGGSRRGEEKRAREASKQAWGREEGRERESGEFELLKPNEQSIPCQLAKGCQERTRPIGTKAAIYPGKVLRHRAREVRR